MAGCALRALRSCAGNVVGLTVYSTSVSTHNVGALPTGVRRLHASAFVGRMTSGSDGASPGKTTVSSGDIKPELVRQYLSPDQFNAKETNRLNLKQIREGFANHAHDCGGTEVQIAALTEKIRYMTGHLSTHHKDKSSRRGLIAMLERRKKLLKYLRRSNGDSYGEVIYRLGLKDRSFVEDKYVKSNKK